MIMKANKQIGFIYKNNESIDKILKDGEVVFERGFLREKTSTTLPITFGGVGKDLKDYKIDGNTHQNSTTGKNLLNYIDTIVSSGGGLTNVINDDGSITTTGIPTSNYRPILSQYDIIDDLEDGQTYTISSETLNRFLYIQINAVKIAGGTDYIYNSNSRAVQFTVDKSKYNAYNIKIQTSTTSGWGSNSRTITNKYQLEKGATATEFEPYTGGRPSPNPDYPQEIISCGDRTKNLFDKANATYKNGYYKNDNGVEQSTQTSGYLTSYIQVKPNTIYTIQGSLKQTNQSSHSYAIYYYNINKQWISRTVITNNPPYTFTTPNDCYFIQFQYRQDAYGEDTIQIEEGSTATSYEPYGYKIPVNVRSDNIFSNNIIENGYLLEESGTINANSNYYICKEINIKPLSKYILSENQNYSVSTFTPVRVCAYDKDNNFIALLLNNRRTEAKRYNDEFIIPAGTEYILISFRNTDTNLELVESIDTNIYLDEPLRKSKDGTCVDYIDFINKKVIRNNMEIILDGSESAVKAGQTSTYYRFGMTTYNSITKKSNAINCFSNMFLANSNQEVNTFYIATTSGNLSFSVPTDFITSYDSSAFLSKLQELYNNGTPVIINIPLLTPTEESITLPDIPTIDGNNTLNIETEITPSQVYIKYKSNE